MVRRRLAVKRLDPWSMLKFAAVANVVFFLVMVLVAAVIWFVVDRLELIDQACDIATEIGFQRCVVDGGTVMRIAALLAGMLAIVNTAVLVFAAFLHNLIADLTGGLVLGVVEDGPVTQHRRTTDTATTTGGSDATPAPTRAQATASSTSNRADATGPQDRGELFGER